MKYDEFGNPIITSDMMDPTLIFDADGHKLHVGDNRLVDPTTVDYNKLASLGFDSLELGALSAIINNYYRVNNTLITNYSMATGIQINPLQSQRIMYAYHLLTGKETINTQSYKSVAAHARKMFKGTNIKFDFTMIGARGKHEIPRTAVVDGLTGPFAVWNSRDYPKMERAYKVEKIAKEYVTIVTDRKPILKFNDSTEVPGILKILSNEKGIITVQIHKKFCRLCNRFVILVSKTNPDRSSIIDNEDKFNSNYDPSCVMYENSMEVMSDEYTHGCAVIVAEDGTILYVYAKTMGFDKYGNSKANISDTNSTKVLDYGFYSQEIEPKLRNIETKLYKQVKGIFIKEFSGSRTYQEISNISTEDIEPEDTSDIE